MAQALFGALMIDGLSDGICLMNDGDIPAETIAKIRQATKHLKGLKIGIRGCIVNGPGEMADADYGYVGAGPNKVSLYRKQVCVEKNIPQEVAVEHLLALINGDKEK